MKGRRSEVALLAGLAVWGLTPIVLIALSALVHGERLTGADGPIAGDQLQYLAWIRDAGRHGLAANLFTLEPAGHVFAHPMFTLSGALTALGAPLELAYLVWKPVAVLVLFLGGARLMARAFPERPGARAAALALALLCYLPTAAIAGWTASGTPGPDGLVALGGELFPAGELWGYLPTAMAIGLLPIGLLAAERGLLAPRPAAWRPLAVAGLAGLLAAWAHPWQGATFALILLGLVVSSAWRESLLRLAPVLLLTALPLAYYELLAAHDPAWRLAAHNELVPHLRAGVLIAGLLPPIVLAATGVRRTDGSPFERALLLWVPAGLITYFVLHAYPAHALETLSLPLAIFAVRGFTWLRLPAWAGGALVGLLVLPGLVYVAQQFADTARSPDQLLYLSRSDARALDWLARGGPGGGVLASPRFSFIAPAQTGRRVWVGHPFWSRDYPQRSAAIAALFGGHLAPRAAQTVAVLSGARLLAADCATAPGVLRELRPVLATTRRFGCATVAVLR